MRRTARARRSITPPAAAPAVDPPESHTLILDDLVPELDLELEGVVVEGQTSPPPLEVTQETERLENAEPDTSSPRKAKRAKGEAASGRSAPPPPQVPPRQTLSKFRHAEATIEDENEVTNGGNQLGRIPLVRVRRGRDGAKKPSTLARLLASF